MAKKDGVFTWKRKEPAEFSNELKNEEPAYGIKGDEDFMAFSEAAGSGGEMKKTEPEAAVTQPESLLKSSASLTAKRDESYISKDLVVGGSISGTSNIIIEGTVNGNVTTDSDVTVCGNVEGNIKAGSVKFAGARIKGDITCRSNLSVAKETVVNGNITGKNVEINGTLTGNLTVEESAVIMGGAVINGDISAGIISVMEGAVIKGNVQVNGSAAGAKIPPISVPDDEKPVKEDESLLKRYI